MPEVYLLATRSFPFHVNIYFWWPPHFCHAEISLKESQKGINTFSKKNWKAFLNGILIKAPFHLDPIF